MINWDAVGAIGEILGALAVFISLTYLAVQIRSSTNQNRAAISQSIQAEFARGNELVATSPDLAALFVKASARQELTDADSRRLNAFVTASFAKYVATQFAYNNGQLDPQYFQMVCADVKRLSEDRGWAATVRQMIKAYPGANEFEIFQSLYREND